MGGDGRGYGIFCTGVAMFCLARDLSLNCLLLAIICPTPTILNRDESLLVCFRSLFLDRDFCSAFKSTIRQSPLLLDNNAGLYLIELVVGGVVLLNVVCLVIIVGALS